MAKRPETKTAAAPPLKPVGLLKSLGPGLVTGAAVATGMLAVPVLAGSAAYAEAAAGGGADLCKARNSG